MTISPQLAANIRDMIAAMEEPVLHVLAIAQQDKVTKDGYGTVLSFISGLKKSIERCMFLAVCVHYGYSYSIAEQIAGIIDDKAGFLAAITLVNDATNSNLFK